MGKKSKRKKTKDRPDSAVAARRELTRGGIVPPSGYDVAAQVKERVLFGNESMIDVVSDMYPGLSESRRQAIARDLTTEMFDQPATRFDIEQTIAQSIALDIMDRKAAAEFRKTVLEKPKLSRAELMILCQKKAGELDDEEDRIRKIVGDICSEHLNVAQERKFHSAAKFALNGLDIPREKTLLCENGEGYRLVFLVWLIGAIVKKRTAASIPTDNVKDRAYDAALLISECEEESMMARSLAMMIRSKLLSGYPSREATYLKRALVYANQVPDDMLTEPVVLPCRKGEPGNSVPVTISVRDIFDGYLVASRSSLVYHQGAPTSTMKQLDSGRLGLRVLSTGLYRIAAGGSRCDVCNKLPENVGLIALHKCKRCRLAFYCSTECQAKAWKEHASHCKKWNCFKEGDRVVLQGLRKRPDLNESIVRIIEKVSVVTAIEPNSSKRWKAELIHSSNKKKNTIFTVKPENCRHLRPLA